MRWLFRLYEVCTPYFLTVLGVWTPHLSDSYGILSRARRNIHSLEKGDDPVQDVLRITGATRGLLWCLCPGLGFVSRFSEAANSPPIFVFDRRLTLRQPFRVRLCFWLLGMTQFAFAIAFALTVRIELAATLYASLVVLFVIQVWQQWKARSGSQEPATEATSGTPDNGDDEEASGEDR
jgi:hypothetical protein